MNNVSIFLGLIISFMLLFANAKTDYDWNEREKAIVTDSYVRYK